MGTPVSCPLFFGEEGKGKWREWALLPFQSSGYSMRHAEDFFSPLKTSVERTLGEREISVPSGTFLQDNWISPQELEGLMSPEAILTEYGQIHAHH